MNNELVKFETAKLAKEKGFKEIPIAPDYLINEQGVILGLNLQEMKSCITKNGYVRVLLSKPERKKYLVHRLVALTFIDNPSSKPQVNHKDGNKTNNCVDNLEWCTHSENGLHSYQFLGRTKFWEGKKYNNNPLSKSILCVDTGEIFENSLDAENKTFVKSTSINRCCNGYRSTAGGFIWKYFNNDSLTDLARLKGFQSLDENNVSLLYMTLLQRWLREVHDIHIIIESSNQVGFKHNFYNYLIWLRYESFDIYPKYEEALEAGLIKALELL